MKDEKPTLVCVTNEQNNNGCFTDCGPMDGCNPDDSCNPDNND